MKPKLLVAALTAAGVISTGTAYGWSLNPTDWFQNEKIAQAKEPQQLAQAQTQPATPTTKTATAPAAAGSAQPVDKVEPPSATGSVVIAPTAHPIHQAKHLTLHEIARHPIVTYAFAFTGRSQINAAFSSQGLRPEVVLSAIDADIIKTYVKMGFGVGIVAKMAFDDQADGGLHARDASHLFPDSTTFIGIARGAYLRGYVYSFIEMFAPHLRREAVDVALSAGSRL